MKHFLFYSLLFSLSLILFSACDEVLEMQMDAPYDASISKSELSELMVNDPALEARIAEGLEVWRKPGIIIEDAACNDCHAPDALDLAFFDFSDNNIKRRAEPHVGTEGAEKIVDLIHAIREKYKLEKLEDPHQFRLMQPGGEVIQGNTVAEREVAFAKQVLEVQLPSLVIGEITSLEDAKAARDEALALDMQNTKIGIPLPLWSNDIFHGEGFGSPDEWLPNFPNLPTTRDYMVAQNNYIKDPTEENFWALLKSAEENTTMKHMDRIARRIERSKFLSMLIGQHILRNKALGIEGFVEPQIGFRRIGLREIPDFDARHDGGKLPSDHIWDVAELSRKPNGDKSLNTGKYHPESTQGRMERMGYEEFSIEGTAPNKQKRWLEHKMMASWWWLHLMFHHQRKTGYLMSAAMLHHYELHADYSRFVLNMKEGFSDEEGFKTWNDRWGPRGLGKEIFFAEEPQHQAVIKKFKVNSAWVTMYLAKHFMDIEKQAFNDDGMDGIARATNTIKALNPERAQEALNMFYDICSRNQILIQELGKPGGEPLKGDCDYYINRGHNGGDGNAHTGE